MTTCVNNKIVISLTTYAIGIANKLNDRMNVSFINIQFQLLAHHKHGHINEQLLSSRVYYAFVRFAVPTTREKHSRKKEYSSIKKYRLENMKMNFKYIVVELLGMENSLLRL